MNEYWYHLYTLEELPNVPWLLFRQTVLWNLAGTEFILEYKEEPADKTGVLTREEAAALSKTDEWQNNDPNLGQA
jgi:hypothetical protein